MGTVGASMFKCVNDMKYYSLAIHARGLLSVTLHSVVALAMTIRSLCISTHVLVYGPNFLGLVGWYFVILLSYTVQILTRTGIPIGGEQRVGSRPVPDLLLRRKALRGANKVR